MTINTPLTILIPLGGIGSRFQKEGYTAPKPFVRILGREMILWILDSLNPMQGDELVIVYNPNFMDRMGHLMRSIVTKEYPGAIFVELSGPTRGAAETVLLGLQGMPEQARKRPIMVMDGDTFYENVDVIS